MRFWGFGVLGCWEVLGFGVLGGFGFFGVLVFLGFWGLGFWGFGVLGRWGFGVLVFWCRSKPEVPNPFPTTRADPPPQCLNSFDPAPFRVRVHGVIRVHALIRGYTLPLGGGGRI